MDASGDMTALAEVADLLYEEARLLDERRFAEWLALYTDDAIYWMPARWGQQSIADEVSLFHDDHMTLRTRIGRLIHPRAHAQLPPSRTVHFITNVRIAGEAKDVLRAHSSCLFHEFRAPDRTVLAALVEHHLRREEGRLRIAWKRVDLLECDQPHRSLQVPI
jgi:benzoate/toluate 1,2-dioxygenase beta subunit